MQKMCPVFFFWHRLCTHLLMCTLPVRKDLWVSEKWHVCSFFPVNHKVKEWGVCICTAWSPGLWKTNFFLIIKFGFMIHNLDYEYQNKKMFFFFSPSGPLIVCFKCCSLNSYLWNEGFKCRERLRLWLYSKR